MNRNGEGLDDSVLEFWCVGRIYEGGVRGEQKAEVEALWVQPWNGSIGMDLCRSGEYYFEASEFKSKFKKSRK